MSTLDFAITFDEAVASSTISVTADGQTQMLTDSNTAENIVAFSVDLPAAGTTGDIELTVTDDDDNSITYEASVNDADAVAAANTF